MDEAYLLARQHQEAMVLAWVEWLQLMVRCGLGDYNGALQHMRDGLALSERLGERFYRGRILNTVGWLYGDLCNWDLALEYNAQGLAVARMVGDVEIIRNAELNLGDCHLALGQLDEAQRYLESVERESRRQHGWGEAWMKWRYTQHLSASMGELWLARGDPERARDLADQTLGRAQATRALRNVIKARRLKGEALLALGEAGLAESELVEGLGAARRDGNPVQLWKTLEALGRVQVAQARPAEATGSYREAIAIVERIAAGLSDVPLRATLLGSSQVARLRSALALSEQRI